MFDSQEVIRMQEYSDEGGELKAPYMKDSANRFSSKNTQSMLTSAR